MKIVYFTHSLRSCWNHGNAHFLRGVLRELVALGHDVSACEPADSWSAANLVADHGAAELDAFTHRYPELLAIPYDETFDIEAATQGADLVVVHEWNAPALVAALGRARRSGGSFTLLFHDTHHRAVSAPDAIRAFDLDGFDGVLAFGASLAEVYRGWGWGRRVFVWHEAADTRLFQPPMREGVRDGLVWIGNWGDGERGAELREFLLEPAKRAALPLDIHGVRYPEGARAMLAAHGARYCGWLANFRAPEIFARHLATVHVPRRWYARLLPGIPTIRVFESLACGMPLVSAPWEDSESLFSPGADYLVARDGVEMERHLAALRDDPGLRRSLAAHGLATIRSRHTCGHRATELLAIHAALAGGVHARSAA